MSKDQTSNLLTQIFTGVYVCAPDGAVLESQGLALDASNVFDSDYLKGVRKLLLDCQQGVATETTASVADHHHARVRGVPLENGFAVTVEETLHPFARARRSKLTVFEYEFIVRNMRQGIWRLDDRGVVETANDYLADWLETTSADLIGSSCDEWMVSRDPHGTPDRFEAEFRTVSGLHRRALVARSELISLKGRYRGSVDIVTDITAEHALRTSLVAEVQRMSRLARTDPLTGLANRMEYEETLRRLQVRQEPFALVLADVDDFKDINDTQGHAAGDQALTRLAERLKACVRDTDLVARLGGDEFAVLLPGASRDTAHEVVRRIRERTDSDADAQVSVGWSHSTDGVENISMAADSAMYEDKRSRKRARHESGS